MELLTGKSKEHFLEWLDKQDLAPYKVMFDEVPLIVQASYIIEWFDIVGCVICIGNIYYDGYHFNWNINMTKPVNSENGYETRAEATTEAIKSAVKIYNEKHI